TSHTALRPSFHPAEGHHAVLAAEPEGVRDGVVHGLFPRAAGHVVQIAVGIRCGVVDRRRDDALGNGHRAQHSGQAPGGADEVPEHGLRSGDRYVIGRGSERGAERRRLGAVVGPRGGAVRAHQVHIARVQPRAPQPLGDGPGGVSAGGFGGHDVERIAGQRSTEHLGIDARPRARACAKRSITITTAPSPKTNPSRSASKGRLACSGASLWVDSARMALSPLNIAGVIEASVPPTMTTSASSASSSRRASKSAYAPLAQARALAFTGPWMPWSIAISQAGIFVSEEGTNRGLILRSCPASSFSVASWTSG